MKKLVMSAAMLVLVSTTAWGAECSIKITREACPGKETEALKPYDGKKETEEKKDVADEAACSAFAAKTVKIVRKGTLASKQVKATFAGKAIATDFSDKKACK